MFGRLLANQGFSKIMGLKRFAAAGRQIGRGAAETWRGAKGAGIGYRAGMRGPALGWGMESGISQMGKGFKSMGRWAMGAGAGQGAGRYGAAAARTGAAGIGVGITADFLNPWGFGWGD